MRKPNILTFTVVVAWALLPYSIWAQQSSIHHKKNVEISDSLRNHPYPYTLPIFGKKTRKLGYEIPLPYGVMFNYVHQVTKLNITNLSVGIGDLGPEDMDFVEFEPVENVANVFNFRADAWVFPFLNIYGIYAYSEGRAGININFPVDLDIQTTPTVETFGGGLVLAYGRNDWFGAFNLNLSSSNTSAIDEPVFGRVTSFRVGKTFRLKNHHNKLSFSIGLQNQYVQRRTGGSISISEGLASLDEDKLNDFKENVVSNAQNWYEDLSLGQKLVVDRFVEVMEEYLDGRDLGDTEISYFFEKEVFNPWTTQFGIQYMNNKNYWYRLEYGVGSGRQQILLSFNYRFGF